MAVLNLDASEPYAAPVTNADSSALFPSAPIYARKPAKKSSANLPLIVGLPVLAIAAGGLAWGLMSQPARSPSTDAAPAAKVAEAQPLPTAQPPAPMPTPAPAEATPAPTQVARAETTAPPRVTAPAKRAAAPARRAAPATAPDAESASSNVSATIPAPVAAPAPTPVIAAPAAPAPTPTPAPLTPVTPDAPM